MNSGIARERLASVLKTDSVAASQGDFLATHVAVRKLHLMSKFTYQPASAKEYTEEAVYREYIRNPKNRHQFITVCGQSGTGKSHLIRWFEARFEQEKQDDEVVLFIRRSDNTLKGTIRQLLEKPEVRGIANRDVYERLVRASANMDADKLKGMIYHNFINEIEYDAGDRAISLNNIQRKRLIAFLSNDVIRNAMLDASGPIERIYSKIEEHTLVDRDTVAQFLPSDFRVNADLFEEIQQLGADRNAEKLALGLMSDTDGPEDAKKFANYLNQFVNDVIQRCAGIEPGDFRQIFQDIRKELCRIGKSLTLFIEDVTSFTGVDDALLDALIVEHTGMNAEEGLCRISSIVGTTDNYLQNHFRDNHKDRITQYVYIPSDVFDREGVFEFVGRYLNTMSLPERDINAWLQGRAEPADYPMHEVKEGANWEFVPIENDKKLCLYPFTKRSIIYMYNYCMTQGQKTPRYIIRDIIEPVVNDMLNNSANFPSLKIKLVNVNTTLSYRIQSQIRDEALSDRYLRFLSVWGDGKPEQYAENGSAYISSVRKEIIEELGFPALSFSEVEPPKSGAGPAPVPAPPHNPAQPPPTQNNDIQLEVRERVAKANQALTDWSGGQAIDVSSSVGVADILRVARIDMDDYLRSAINWQAEGFSMDNMSKMKTTKLIMFENQTKETKGGALYSMPANWESLNVIGAFIRWHEFGRKSWNYPDSDFDAYLVTTWTAKVKDEIVRLVRNVAAPDTPYIEAAITAEIYRQILCGMFRERSLKNFTAELLFQPKQPKSGKQSHSNEWNSLVGFISDRGAGETNRKTVRQYFNITQGDGGSIVVLDEPNLMRELQRVKRNRLCVPAEDMGKRDDVKLRRDVYDYLGSIFARADRVARAELQGAKPCLEAITARFGDGEIDEEDIKELADRAKAFYKEINNSQINISVVSTDAVKRNARQTAKAIADINEVLDSDDALKILMTFSGDPVSDLKPLEDLLNQLDRDVEKADKLIADKLDALGEYARNDASAGRYADELSTINANQRILEGGF